MAASRKFMKNVDSGSRLMMAKLVSIERLAEVARQLVARHRPLAFNYCARFAIGEDMLRPTPAPAVAPASVTTTAACSLPATAPPATAVEKDSDADVASVTASESIETAKLTTSRLAKTMGMKTADLSARLIDLGLLEPREGKNYITAKGKAAGGEFRMSPKHGPYFLWPEDLAL